MVKVATSKSAKLVMLELQIEIDWSGNFFKWLLDCETKNRYSGSTKRAVGERRHDRSSAALAAIQENLAAVNENLGQDIRWCFAMSWSG
jgi:hypothetical protein